ncbi:hypothetical protein GCM10023091_08250 [Ravibacter arvi]|uniref:Glycosyltransferase n=1 Tax=Ravibacter arvi TaxID=2051041 RepID=A0ABP8LQJ7_9BACT
MNAQFRRRRILYLSFNDGSDTRVNKEVASLAAAGAEIDFVGLGVSPETCFVSKLNINRLYFTRGRRLAPLTLFRYFKCCCHLLIFKRYHSVHVINEPQLMVLWPLLWLQKRVVADLFDSIFLRRNWTGNSWGLLKKLLYKPAEVIFVTDESRFRLSTDYVKRKTVILPNYPPPFEHRVEQNFNDECLTILYCGRLSSERGTKLLSTLIRTGKRIRILMAGWIADAVTYQLTLDPRVEWFGVLKQESLLRLAALRADFLLCIYEPDSDYGRYASHHKVYDSIQVEKPAIINREIRIADFVRSSGTGFIIPSFQAENADRLYDDLVSFKKQFVPNRLLKQKLTWTAVEKFFLKAHNLGPHPPAHP